MCHNTVTLCICCNKYIDSIVFECRNRQKINTGGGNVGRCPETLTFDGYAINPISGMPFDPANPIEFGVYLHQLREYRAVCVWCRAKFSDQDWEHRRNEIHEYCSGLYSLTYLPNGRLHQKSLGVRWELIDEGQGDHCALWHEGERFKLQKVSGGEAREARPKIPNELTTPTFRFPFYETTVLAANKLLDLSLEDTHWRGWKASPLKQSLEFTPPNQLLSTNVMDVPNPEAYDAPLDTLVPDGHPNARGEDLITPEISPPRTPVSAGKPRVRIEGTDDPIPYLTEEQSQMAQLGKEIYETVDQLLQQTQAMVYRHDPPATQDASNINCDCERERLRERFDIEIEAYN